MPSLIKKSGSDVWFIRFRHNGQDRLKSSGETDWRKARKQLKTADAEARLDRTVDDHMGEILTLLQNMPSRAREEARQRLLSNLQRSADCKLSLTDTWSEWLKLPKDTTQATLAGYDPIWRQFSSWLQEHRPDYLYLGQVTASDASAYASHLWQTRVAPVTFNLHVSFLRRLWRELQAPAGLIENVWAGIEKRRKNTISREPLSRDQLTTIIQRATGELRNMLLVGLCTSLRLKDVVFLDSSKFNEIEGVLELTPFKTRRIGKKVRVPVHAQLLPLLKNPPEGGLYFPEMAKRYKAMPADVSRIVQNHLEACGIKTLVPIEEGVRRKRAAVRFGFHSLRYSFVSLAAKARTPQHVLSELVGHETPQMTLAYSRADDSQRAKAIKALPTITA